ncbi:hypothetical protein [Brachyspira hampsonii]|uniref:hypothetical protein n=1 Tax=Brachyspira hampsonii TaxID=1287055 RepID=UPI000D3675D7|nr:hypothetical protein [Brachyspira hampsonii]PTY41391.1 hypothetical protein DQ06_13080 [Brachyspira hampsonii bv. II]
MKNKLILYLILVLALAVSCKNNTTDSTATGTTITMDMLEEELNNIDDNVPISENGSLTPSNFAAIIIYNDPAYLPDIGGDADDYLTANSVKKGLDNGFAGIPNSKINYEVNVPTITADGKQDATITIKLTPKNSNDKFAESGWNGYCTVDSDKQITIKVTFEATWKK